MRKDERMNFRTMYVFKPRSRERETLPKISPLALERETVEERDALGTLRVLGGDLLTLAKELDGSHVLAWLDGQRTLVLVDRADLKEVLL